MLCPGLFHLELRNAETATPLELLLFLFIQNFSMERLYKVLTTSLISEN